MKCMRVESETPVESGGWVHQLRDPLPPLPPPKPVEKKLDWTAECKAMFAHEQSHDKRASVADMLSVSVESLELLRVGVGWDDWNGAEFSSWPSRDAEGRCIGYVRRYSDGTKRTNVGGSTGVFYTPNWNSHPGPLFIVEGGSDVAACESANLCAIGRASNTYGGEWIKAMIRQACPDKKIIVVGERDEAPERRGSVASCPSSCRGCAFCWPGLYGMKKVAAELGGVGVLVPPAFKDMREMLVNGGLWLDLIETF